MRGHSDEAPEATGSVRAAVVQLRSTPDFARNLTEADTVVRAAAAAGAQMVVLPEKWPSLGDAETILAGAQPLDGPAVTWARGVAADLSIDLIAGSFSERRSGEAKTSNTCVHVGVDGMIAAEYRKVHLFDVCVDGTIYRESAAETAGTELVVTTASAGAKIGLLICYDVRFCEQARNLALAGADILAVPAAFTAATTRDHWEILLRARAIENGCFVLAANQTGEHTPTMRSGGESMIVDPWGIVLARVTDGVGFAVADLDLLAPRRIRERLGVVANRRSDVYRRDVVEAG